MNYLKLKDEIDLQIEGYCRPLFYSPGISRCASIRDGVMFRFGGEGFWVVSLETLRKIVESEDILRATEHSKHNNQQTEGT